MKDKLHVIYIPGVGDNEPGLQKRAIRWWSLWGVDSEFLQMNWANDESWSDKSRRIQSRVEELKTDGKNVALVGASAGAAAALSAYGAQPTAILAVVLICGKLKNPSNIGPKYRQHNPALLDCVSNSEKALINLNSQQKSRILTRRAFFDEVVTTKSDSVVKGARNQVSPTIGHAVTIGVQLVIGAPSFLRFLKRQNT